MTTEIIIANTKQMIDDLKTVCANFGLGNASSEYKIITEIFLYKFLNDKFLYEVRQADEKLKDSENVEQALNDMSDDDYDMLMMLLPPATAKLKREHFISYLFRAAIVVPTGFLTAGTGIPKTIRERIVGEKMLRGVVSMPSNIFATTGTNVSVVFLDNTKKYDKAILMDASKLGTKVKVDGKNQRTVLSDEEIEDIISTFNNFEAKEDFSVVVDYDKIEQKKCSFSAGQYFEVKIEYVELTQEEFQAKMDDYTDKLKELFAEGNALQAEILEQLKKVKYEANYDK